MKLPDKLIERLEAHPKLQDTVTAWRESFDPREDAADLHKAYTLYVCFLVGEAVDAGILWVTRQREVRFVEEIDDRHLTNIVRYLRARLETQIEAESAAVGFASGCTGEMARDAAWEGVHETAGRGLRTARLLANMEAEADRRGLEL